MSLAAAIVHLVAILSAEQFSTNCNFRSWAIFIFYGKPCRKVDIFCFAPELQRKQVQRD